MGIPKNSTHEKTKTQFMDISPSKLATDCGLGKPSTFVGELFRRSVSAVFSPVPFFPGIKAAVHKASSSVSIRSWKSGWLPQLKVPWGLLPSHPIAPVRSSFSSPTIAS